jgi:hypothetical protein
VTHVADGALLETDPKLTTSKHDRLERDGHSGARVEVAFGVAAAIEGAHHLQLARAISDAGDAELVAKGTSSVKRIRPNLQHPSTCKWPFKYPISQH